MKLHLYRDAQGHPKAQTPSPYETLGWFLEEDVQSVPSTCHELIDLVDDIQAGRRSYSKSTGNSFRLILTSATARIESLFSDPPEVAELPLDDLRQALVDWMAFIRS